MMTNSWSLLAQMIEDGEIPEITITMPGPNYKFNEDKCLDEAREYIVSTYKAHYTSDKNVTQTLDLIESIGDAEPFCRSNAIKYLSRYDKKGTAKQDILKAIHYCVLLYHFSKQDQPNSEPYETF
jgi:hypothetical protein|tara:strand:- start:448 stop:822 length:375 start_codon:yes stop_codon:yes gene_type:complete